jgi:hypothetical protein
MMADDAEMEKKMVKQLEIKINDNTMNTPLEYEVNVIIFLI